MEEGIGIEEGWDIGMQQLFAAVEEADQYLDQYVRTLEVLYDEAFEEVQETYEVQLEKPAFTIDGNAGTSFSVVVDDTAAFLSDPVEFVEDELFGLYNTALESCVDGHRDGLMDLYAPFDPDFRMADEGYAVFQDLNEDDDKKDTPGSYGRNSKQIKIDVRYMEDICPITGDAKTEKFDQLVRHETVHAMHYGSNQHLMTYRDNVDKWDADDEYNIELATLEAITKFEQYRHRDRDSNREKEYRTMLKNPWKIPSLFEEGKYMSYEPGTSSLFDSPYRLGHFASLAVDQAFREKYGAEKGRELTREFLLFAVTTPMGLEGAIEHSFRMRNVPYYPETVERWTDMLENSESKEVLAYLQAARELMMNTKTQDMQVRVFNESAAMLLAYEQLEEREGDEAATLLESELEETKALHG